MFATRPEPARSRGTSKPAPGVVAHEAGAHPSNVVEGITGELGPIDPAVFGIDSSDFVTHAAPVGAGSGSRSGPPVDPFYPMAGEMADEFMSTLQPLREAIASQIKDGRTGRKLVHLHDDFEAYVNAVYTDSLEIRASFIPGIPNDVMESIRKKRARELAQKSPGFTSPETRVVHIYTRGTPGFVTIHEMIHAYTDKYIYSLGSIVLEGLADYFTSVVCEQNDIPFRASYAAELSAIQILAETVGQSTLASWAFMGNEDGIKAIIEANGVGTWKKYKVALRKGQYDVARNLILGAGQMYQSTTSMNEEGAAILDDGINTMRSFEQERLESQWPPEARSPVTLRMLRRLTLGGVEVGGVNRGGRHGIRSSWKAFFVSDSGETETRIVSVESDMTYVAIPHESKPGDLDVVELRPSVARDDTHE